MTPYQDPLQAEDHKPLAEDLQKAADVLNEYQRLMAGQPDMDGINAYHRMHWGALAQLQARLAEDGPDASGSWRPGRRRSAPPSRGFSRPTASAPCPTRKFTSPAC